MSTFKQQRTLSDAESTQLGLAGVGSSGSWEIAIDEMTSGATRWFAQIEGPSIYLRFEIASLQVLDDAIAMLASSASLAGKSTAPSSPTRLMLGEATSSAVELLQDDEFSDRYFLVVKQSEGPLVRMTIAGDNLEHLVACLKEVV
ncbi:MAG TPA: hypothetical protein VFI31_10445, partial [Pirellulales bacterium]|nr:hypothetical protein [Pirellulales bacterium]